VIPTRASLRQRLLRDQGFDRTFPDDEQPLARSLGQNRAQFLASSAAQPRSRAGEPSPPWPQGS